MASKLLSSGQRATPAAPRVATVPFGRNDGLFARSCQDAAGKKGWSQSIPASPRASNRTYASPSHCQAKSLPVEHASTRPPGPMNLPSAGSASRTDHARVLHGDRFGEQARGAVAAARRERAHDARRGRRCRPRPCSRPGRNRAGRGSRRSRTPTSGRRATAGRPRCPCREGWCSSRARGACCSARCTPRSRRAGATARGSSRRSSSRRAPAAGDGRPR